MKKNEDLLNGFGNIDDVFIEEARVKRRDYNFSVKIASLVACIAIFLGALTVYMFIPYGNPTDRYSDSEYYSVITSIASLDQTKSYKNRFEKLSESLLNSLGAVGKGGAAFAPSDDADMEFSPESSAPDGSVGGEYVETTDNQVEGVIEADLFKRTSTHIFYLNGKTLYTYSIDKEESELKSKLDIALPSDLSYILGGKAEMYLSLDGKTVSVIYPYISNSKEYSVAIVSIDVSNPESPRANGTVVYSGSYLSSRLDGETLLVFTSFTVDKADYDKPETFVPTVTEDGETECISPDKIVIPERPCAKRYTVVSALDVGTMQNLSSLALFSYAETVYVSEGSIYAVGLAYFNGDGKGNYTDITRIDYGTEGLEKKGSYTVPGTVLNQYSLDEREGVLRAVTTVGDGTWQGSSASLFCIDKESGEIIGKVERFAPEGEEVTSVRFDGDKAYVCTAVRITFTDPVFFFDLSDYENITYTDTGYIDGFSSSLINYPDGVLLGMGEDNNTTLKVETYAEAEGQVVSLDEYTLYGEASDEYKAYLVNREEGLFGFGVRTYDPYNLETPYRYILLKVEKGELTELLNVPLFADPDEMRAVYIDGYLYAVGASDFRVESVNIG